MAGWPSCKLRQAEHDGTARSLRAVGKLMDIHVVVALVGAALAALVVVGRRSTREPDAVPLPVRVDDEPRTTRP
jgi:hypothetical protein